jgi:membrane associated rhomboid family serine protease
MIPLRDANPTTRRPYFTLALIAINAAVFFLWQRGPLFGAPTQGQVEIWVCNGVSATELSSFDVGARVAEVCDGKSVVLSIFTSMFLHANLFHIAGNMLFLWIFGNNVEDRMGHLVYLLFYLVSGIAAAYGQALTESGSAVPMIGASGAIAGVLGSYIVMYPRARVVSLVFLGFFVTVIELPALVVLGLWAVFQAVSGLGSLTGPGGGGVAFFAHLGGFVFGLLIALLFYRRRREAFPRPLDY